MLVRHVEVPVRPLSVIGQQVQRESALDPGERSYTFSGLDRQRAELRVYLFALYEEQKDSEAQ